MKERPYLKAIAQWAIAAALAFIAARYGIVIPPPTVIEKDVPPIEQPKPPPLLPNIKTAIGRIQFGSSGCTATPIGPKDSSGRYRLVTAAHCVQAVGQRGQFRSQAGDVVPVTVSALDRKSDCAWLVSDSTNVVLPFAELATELPNSGSAVWHAGYGVDRPGNREDGTFVGGPDSNGQLKFNLSVSSGDSGGAIVADASGRVLAVVCCTGSLARRADVWGAGPDAIRALQRTAADDWHWTPIAVPEHDPPKK